MVPKVAFTGFAARYRAPTVEEGFEDVCVVDFVVSRIPPSRSKMLRAYAWAGWPRCHHHLSGFPASRVANQSWFPLRRGCSSEGPTSNVASGVASGCDCFRLAAHVALLYGRCTCWYHSGNSRCSSSSDQGARQRRRSILAVNFMPAPVPQAVLLRHGISFPPARAEINIDGRHSPARVRRQAGHVDASLE